MLIVLEVKIKLPVIVFFILHKGRLEEFVNVILDKQRVSQDARDLNDWTVNLMIMFNDIDEAVCDDSNMYLNTDSILCLAPEGLDFEMLLDPFEEQFDLPSVLVKKCDFTCFEIEVIRIVCNRSLQTRSIIDNASERNRIVTLIPAPSESDSLVSKDIILSSKQILAILNFIVRMELLPDNEEGASLFNGKEPRQIEVSAIKDIAGKSLIFNPVHRVDVMNLCCRDSVKHRYFCSNINLRVNSDTAFRTPEFCPSEDGETEVNGCRVNCIESSMKLKLLGDSSLLSLADHIEGKFFIDPVITESIGLGDDTSVRSGCSETVIVRTLGMRLDYVNKFPKTDTARELRIYKHTKMIPMSKAPVPCPVVVSADNTIELTFEPVGYLIEYIVPQVHNCSNLKLGTKVRISNVGHCFQDLLYCA